MPINRREHAVSEITGSRLLAIIRTSDADEAAGAAVRVLSAGLRTVEITMTTPDATRVLGELSAGWPHAMLGAGTVLTAGQAEAAVEAGARFVVAPNLDPSVIEAAHRRDAAAIPGCLTPTEVLAAMDAGADLVKLYPASALGVRAFADLCRALPHVPFVPTGGIGPADAPEWVRAGARAVGMGHALRGLSAGDVRGLMHDLVRARPDR